jgi:hypothetical protein
MTRTKGTLRRAQEAAQPHLPSTIYPALRVRGAEICGWR